MWNPKDRAKVLLDKRKIWTDVWEELAFKSGTFIGPTGQRWPVLNPSGRRILF